MSMRGPFCLLAGYFEVGSFVAKDAKRSRLYWDMYSILILTEDATYAIVLYLADGGL